MYSLLCTIFTWSGFHKFTNTHSHSTPLKWSTLSQTKAKQVVVLCVAKSFQVNKVTEDIQDIPGVDAIMVFASFLKSMICALESRFCFTSTKKTIATVRNSLMSVYTCLVITCKWPTSGHFWLCDRKNHLHMWCLSVSLAPHLSPPVSFFLSPLFDFDHGCICLHPLGWLLHPCNTKTEPSGASFFSTECRPY